MWASMKMFSTINSVVFDFRKLFSTHPKTTWLFEFYIEMILFQPNNHYKICSFYYNFKIYNKNEYCVLLWLLRTFAHSCNIVGSNKLYLIFTGLE